MVTAVANTTATSSTSSSATGLSANYSTFLNLLTAQIKNQDPLSPMDTTQWTNQLVQYSSVEQQLKANSYLETIANNGTQGSMNAAVGYIGKTVQAGTDTTTVTAGGSGNWTYTLPAAATSATLSITNAAGTTVWSNTAPDLSTGSHAFTWDGKDSTGTAVAAGDYTLHITAANAGGDLAAKVGVAGVVTAAQNVDGTVVLQVGNTTIPLSSVTSVS